MSQEELQLRALLLRSAALLRGRSGPVKEQLALQRASKLLGALRAHKGPLGANRKIDSWGPRRP